MFGNNIIMSSQGNIKKNNKSKIRNLTNEELLSEQPLITLEEY